MWIGCQEFCSKLNGHKSDKFLESGWNLIVFNQRLLESVQNEEFNGIFGVIWDLSSVIKFNIE